MADAGGWPWPAACCLGNSPRSIAPWAVFDGLAELAVGGLGRSQRVHTAGSCCFVISTTTAGPGHCHLRIENAGFRTGGERPGHEVPGSHRFLALCRRLGIVCRMIPPRCAAAASAARPAGAKGTFHPRETHPVRTTGGPKLHRRHVLGVAFDRLLQRLDRFARILAGQGDPRQPELGLAEVVDRFPVLIAWRIQLQNLPVLGLGLVKIFSALPESFSVLSRVLNDI